MKKICIIGGGFGGINAALKLKKMKDVEITLFDRANYHLFQPLLYQVATAALSENNIAYPLREVFQNQSNVCVLMVNIAKIDKENQKLITNEGKEFFYDYLIIATGSNHSYFGHPEWETFAPGLKDLKDAISIKDRILMAFERAEKCESLEEANRYLNFAIIGGGPTGVEVAGSIAEFVHHTLQKNFRHIDPSKTHIYLIEGEDQVLPSFPKELAEKALDDLKKLGVTVLLKNHVTNISKEGVFIRDTFIEAPTIIWAAGNQASPLLKTLDIPLDKRGRLKVNKDLSIPGHSNVFVIGDAASVFDKNNQELPAIAPVAIQQGRYVAKILKNKSNPENRPPFNYFDKGMIATIGRGRAVAILRKFKFSGFLAWIVWCFVHIFYLINFRNRAIVFFQWIFLYVAGSRADRIISESIGENK